MPGRSSHSSDVAAVVEEVTEMEEDVGEEMAEVADVRRRPQPRKSTSVGLMTL